MTMMSIVGLSCLPFTRATSPPNSAPYKTLPVLFSLRPSVIFNILPSPVHPIRYSFYIFLGFFAIFILPSSNNNNIHYHKLCLSIIARKKSNWVQQLCTLIFCLINMLAWTWSKVHRVQLIIVIYDNCVYYF